MSPGIETEGLAKRYGQTVALAGVDLAVPQATIWGLLGPNGAGKTTIVRILATLLRADHGTARVAGFDVRREPGQVRAMIGLTGQFAAVDEALTGYENLLIIARLLEMPTRQAKQRADDLLVRFGLGDAAARLVKTYSGGMRRRLDVAASLVGRPKVLFLDEPTTGLDPRARAGVWELVRGLAADGTTVLLTTQYLQEADELCHGVSVIDHGRVVRHGTPAELKATVGGQTLQVRPQDSTRAAETGLIVAELLGGVGAANSDDGMIAMPLPTGYSASATLAAVAGRLESAGIEVAEMGIRLASLDEAFLALTGDHATTEVLR